MSNTPIGPISAMQLLAGDLRKLRQQRKRLSKDETVKENERAQDAIISQLRKAGREDLIRIA